MRLLVQITLLLVVIVRISWSQINSCQEYETKIEQLPSTVQTRLSRDGVAVFLNQVFLDKQVIALCSERALVSGYLNRQIQGLPGDDLRLNTEQRKRIGQIISSIWPFIDRDGVGDGSFGDDKYNLLADPSIPDNSLHGLIVRLLRRSLTPEIAYVLLTRGSADYKSELDKKLSAEGNKSRILAIACLSRTNEERSTLIAHLRKLKDDSQLSPDELTVCDRLANKLKDGKTIVYRDVDILYSQ